MRDTVTDLAAFLRVAREGSFTKAAAQLGVSQPALSRTIRKLEARLGVQLLTRSTRSVAPTEAGVRLMDTIGPHFDGIEAGLGELSELSGKPAGTLRITSLEHASPWALAPAVSELISAYPDITVEISDSYALVDIVAERFDAGVRMGEQLAKDMISLRIGPQFRMALVGAPAYLGRRPTPLTPQDLTEHACIDLRLPTSGGLWSWPFSKDGRHIKVRGDGRLVCSSLALMLDFARAGSGLVYVPEHVVAQDLAHGRLVKVMDDWCRTPLGYHLYYPGRRQHKPAFRLLLDVLRRQAHAGTVAPQ
ncbi:OprD regulatory protein [Pseudomonas sp. M47T1]|uniref:LysR family transcriptional regulator n=1 Tax=Pseudomonas sp. M47T1 TaxID=1179778 RepID=UPI00026075F2|nr:OprD regulatory protein [Pseudomonas sp. M47T1]